MGEFFASAHSARLDRKGERKQHNCAGRGGPPIFPQEYDFNGFLLRILQEYDSKMVMMRRRESRELAVRSEARPGSVTRPRITTTAR